MNNIISFIRKNLIFILLLLVLLSMIFFSVFYLFSQPDEVVSQGGQTTNEPTNRETQITAFSGEYREDGKIDLRWSITEGNQAIQSVQLFHNDQQLGGNMKSLSSYELLESIYLFPTGENVFKLKVVLEDQSILEKECIVTISPIVNMQMTAERQGNSILLKLSYMYNSDDPVTIPRIRIMGEATQVPTYEKTTREAFGELEKAETQFRLHLTGNEVLEDVKIRWFFEGYNISQDFPFPVV